jgi:hypothetical protein
METNNNSTIHIFGYGETQINSKDLSTKEATSSLTSVNALIDAIWAKKPADNTGTEKKYHAINIFNKNDIRWQVKDNGFNIKDTEGELTSLIDALIAELQAKKDAQPVTK